MLGFGSWSWCPIGRGGRGGCGPLFFGADADGGGGTGTDGGGADTAGGVPLGAAAAAGGGIRATVEWVIEPLGVLRRATMGRGFQTCA